MRSVRSLAVAVSSLVLAVTAGAAAPQFLLHHGTPQAVGGSNAVVTVAASSGVPQDLFNLSAPRDLFNL
jgi:hypothetical protein